MPRWTSDQALAIASEGNLIVSAAAGAGKTAVLTERIVSRIRAGAPVESLLVLTFTRAAAAEMKSRIAARLSVLAEEAETTEEMRYLRKQSRNVDSAYISTIHAFCARVLRRHYHAVNLPARAKTADEMESAALIEAVRDELLTQLSTENDAHYTALLAAFGSEQAAWDAILSTYRFTRAEPEPEQWLKKAAARYEDETALTGILSDAVVFCKDELSMVIETILRERDQLSPDCANAISVLDEELSRYRAMLLCKTYGQYREVLFSMEYGRLVFPRAVAEEDKAGAKAAREMGKDLIKEQKTRFLRAEAEEHSALVRSGAVVSALCALTARFEAAYSEAKRERNLVDYDDLEHYALHALSREEIAQEYREKFRWIAVDEYQDSNRVQEAILSRITRGDNLFFVGDVKQSIYRFRQAEPGLFLEKLNRFSGSRGKRIDLASNFRSSAAVLNAVNEVFERVMQEKSADLDYDDRARLVCGREQPQGSAELHLIAKDRVESEEEDALEDAADLEVEARLIAKRIHEIMETETCIDAKTGETRNYRYGDFAVLLRAGTEAQMLSQTLAASGVPAYAQSSGGYFDAIEVQVFRNLLTLIDNRRQDVPLISVLLSGIGDFTHEELAQIRTAHPGGAFYEAFFDYAARDCVLGKRAADFLEKLSRYRAESRLISVEELIGKLLDETGFYEEMGAGISGAQRQANLNALLDKAHAFEASGARGVWNFLRHLALAQDNASIGAAQTVTADVVRILTIHKSKGLEFPVVFVAGLGKQFNRMDVNNSLQLHASFGMALRYIDREGVQRVKRDTIARVILSQRVKREQLAEEMRVLYVAMTRARRKLILTACLNKPEEKLAASPKNPTAWQAIKCASPVRWLMMGAHRHLQITLHERERFLGGVRGAETAREMPPFDPAVLEAIEAKLNWTYAHAEAAQIRAKASVSRVIKGEDSLPSFTRPAFLGTQNSAVFAGTATHAAMQYLPLGQSMDAAQAGDYLSSLVETGRITPEQATAADADAIAWFTQEEIFSRMQRAARLERELPFSYPMDAQLLYGIDAEETVLLQGVLDACFLEENEWVIVDYKTDRIRPNETAEQAASRHAEQLRLYALALESLTGQRVREAIVVLLSYRAVVSV